MARDRPSPYGERGVFLFVNAGMHFFIVARGPVPRECWITRTLARDRPSPYGFKGLYFSVGGDRLIATGSPYGLEGLFSRGERGMARDRFLLSLPYGFGTLCVPCVY